MRTKRAYVDTNIIVYAAVHHPKLGNICKSFIKDAFTGRFKAYGSLLVGMELLGSLSRIEPHAAERAVKSYLSLGLSMVKLDEEALLLASEINR